jgi:branched-chain amino acid transport system permease protein
VITLVMEYLAQQLVNGVTLGSIYGLIAIGYTMVFGIIGMVNFAHGDVFMVSTFIVLIFFLVLTQIVGIGSIFLALLIVLVLAMVFTALWAWVIERLAYRPLRGSFRLAPLISAIGMSILIANFVQLVQGPLNKSIPPLVDGCFYGFGTPAKPCLIERTVDAGRAVPQILNIADKQVLIVATNIILLIIFWYVVQRTALGRAQRACEQDSKMAALLGIDVDRTISITFIIGAALAAVAGQLYVIQYGSVNFADGFVPGVKAFTAAVLGGIGSLPGAVLGGLMIGLIEALWAGYVSSDYKDVAAFSILAITLVFMPSGLLGRPEVEKV